MSKFKFISRGKNNGIDVILSYKTECGTDILCLGVPVSYESQDDWGLGPTWCYVVMKDPVTLVDTGQWGKYGVLISMLEKAGVNLKDIKRVIVTHGHEDHDGNLPEVIEASGAEVWGHFAYESMTSYHPGIDNGAMYPGFPGSCRTCMMPDKFNRACIPYHQKRSRLKQSHKIGKNGTLAGRDYSFILTPGHSPDSVCTVFENEVVFSGDTVLPTITPHPSLVLEYYVQKHILPEEYQSGSSPYGLMAYIGSLRELERQCADTTILLPGHRLFEKGEINQLKPSERAAVIIDFHEERCNNIMNILDNKVLSLEEISIDLFPPGLRKGYGRYLSQREVTSHLELLAMHGDIEWVDGHSFKSRRTGSENYKKYFERRDQ